jgi:hypothetical protein
LNPVSSASCSASIMDGAKKTSAGDKRSRPAARQPLGDSNAGRGAQKVGWQVIGYFFVSALEVALLGAKSLPPQSCWVWMYTLGWFEKNLNLSGASCQEAEETCQVWHHGWGGSTFKTFVAGVSHLLTFKLIFVIRYINSLFLYAKLFKCNKNVIM